jgi:hypothetical protein
MGRGAAMKHTCPELNVSMFVFFTLPLEIFYLYLCVRSKIAIYVKSTVVHASIFDLQRIKVIHSFSSTALGPEAPPLVPPGQSPGLAPSQHNEYANS